MPVDLTTIPSTRSLCRICGGPLVYVLALGDLYLSDFPNSAGTKAHPPVPLDLLRCLDPTCGLVQLRHTTPPEWLYRQYWYRSGVNESMVAELWDVVQGALAHTALEAKDLVVDIGANDGTLLAQYPKGTTRVAFEPARNLYETLRPHAEILYPEYFTVDRPWEDRAKIITSIAMFYDLDDPHAFVQDIARILHPDGVWVVQQAYLPAMLTTGAFDNICHEHLGYYSLRAFERLITPYGLEVVDVELRTVNGGSFRTCVKVKGRSPVSPQVTALRSAEATILADPLIFIRFADRAARIRVQLRALLETYAGAGLPVDLYAASTKANTLLQYCGIDARLIRQAWERSPEKIGRYVGVSGIPIVAEDHGRREPPAALLVGAWQFRDSFVAREVDYLRTGGRLIFPLPEVETVEGVTPI